MTSEPFMDLHDTVTAARSRRLSPPLLLPSEPRTNGSRWSEGSLFATDYHLWLPGLPGCNNGTLAHCYFQFAARKPIRGGPRGPWEKLERSTPPYLPIPGVNRGAGGDVSTVSYAHPTLPQAGELYSVSRSQTTGVAEHIAPTLSRLGRSSA